MLAELLSLLRLDHYGMILMHHLLLTHVCTYIASHVYILLVVICVDAEIQMS